MIPSHPLDLGGIIRESIRIVKRIYWRAALLFIIFTAPGILVVHYGLDNALDGGEVILHKFTAASPEAPKLIRDYLISSNTKSNSFLLYRLTYSKLFHVIDSVKEKVKLEYPDSAHSRIFARLDSIADIVDKQTGKSVGDAILSEVGGGLVISLSGLFLLILGFVACSGALYDLTSRAYEERSFPLDSIFRIAFTQSMWLILIQYVLIFLAMMMGLGLVVTISVAISPVLGAFGLFISTFFLIYAILRILFCRAALVSEELGPIMSIKRSLDLTKDNFWRIFGISLLVGLIIYIAYALIQTPLSLAISSDLTWITEFIRGNTNISFLFRGIKGDILSIELVYFISSALTIAFVPAFLTTFYYDLRTRKEGELEYPDNAVLSIENSENLTKE